MIEEKDLSDLTLDDLVFENRNKSYSSYALRVRYGQYMTRAFIISLTIFLLIAFSPKIKTFLDSIFGTKDNVEMVEKEVEVIAELKDIPIEDDIPPPPPVEIEPPKIETVKFLPPEIKPDKEVKTDELPPKTEALDTTNIASVTQEGEKNLNEMIVDTKGSSVIGGGDDNKVYTYVGEWPEFVGGREAMLKFIGKNFKYPRDAEQKGIEGRVVVGFTVDKTGAITDVYILKGVSTSLDNEAMRVMKSMPNWKPGRNNGSPVRVKYKVDFNCKLPE
jgi:periplasmic protein TonB